MRVLLYSLTLLVLSACASLSDRAREDLEQPGLEGVRWGLVVMTMDGRELVAINPDERFLPASNTKLFTVAAAFHRLGDMTRPDPARGTSLRLAPRAEGPPDLILVGAGDPTLIDAPDCARDCLSDLADALVAQGVSEIAGITADDRLYPRELWPPGWSHEDLMTRSGAPVSALTVNSNEMRLRVAPAATAGEPAEITWLDQAPLYAFDANVITVDDDDAEFSVTLEPSPAQTIVRLTGAINRTGPAVNLPVATQDPSRTAALRLKRLLEARGILSGLFAETRSRTGPNARPLEDDSVEIARLVPPPLIEDVSFLMKQSQNLHAELLLRRLGLIEGDGSREAGLAIVEAMLSEAGAPRWAWDFSDGSGMSVYNRVTPRMTADFLLWTAKQAWGEAFRDTLPIGGVDGTLRRRFGGTALEGRIFAKTGTLRGTNALSGFMLTKSGQMLVFSAFANERPSEAGSALGALDATLVAISETN
ncbi:MAG: D-alanyl-D-alanine carboxypeptidase/D-alanyl-D-alanine-endopeptidase [Hyphomonadaceae bacterium]